MEHNNQNKMPWNTKLGFITSPLMIIGGIFVASTGNKFIGGFFILSGVLRIAMMIYLYNKKKTNT